MEETIEEKQLYLRTEIIMAGYDAQDFSIYLANLKGEEKIDLEYWSLNEIKMAVESYKKSKLVGNEEKKEEKENGKESENILNIDKKRRKFKFFKNILKKRQSSVEQKGKKLNLDEKDIDDKNNIKIISNNKENNNIEVLDFDIIINKKKIKKSKEKKEENEQDDKFIKCEKLEKNELTERTDLNIVINSPTKIKKNLFVNSVQYIIETNPIGFKIIRQLNDFEYLYQKLSLINPQVFIPPLTSNSTKKDSNNKILDLQFYINSILESSYYRSLPIIYDFLSLSLEDWEKAKLEKYDKIKEAYSLDKIKNLEGLFNLELKVGDKEIFLKIKDDINQKSEIFNKLNNSMKTLFDLMEKMSSALSNLSECFSELKDKYNKEKICSNYLANLQVIMKEWGTGYIQQKNYLNNEVKIFFKYMNSENNSFLKFYENFKSNYDSYKSKYEKIRKNNFPSEKDKENIKIYKKELKFNIINANTEYKNLNLRQASRMENLLIKCGKEQKELFNDFHNFFTLLNIFNDKREQEKKFKEKIKPHKNNVNNNENTSENNNNNINI